MQIMNVEQNTPEWDSVRAAYPFTASRAPAMMGASPYQSRDDLMREIKTGIEREIDPYVRDVVFPRGHRIEAAQRKLVETETGEDFFPVTGLQAFDDLELLASYDGLTMAQTLVFECKQWNDEKAHKIEKYGLREFPEYYWQIEQQLGVAGANECIFRMANEKGDKKLEVRYTPVRGRFKKLLAGWRQFQKDLDAYEAPEPKVEVVSVEPGKLPAPTLEVTSMIAASNIDVYRERAMEYIDSIKTELVTDHDFADAEANAKFCRKAQKELKEVKERVLRSSDDVNKVMNVIDELEESLRVKALNLEKLVKSEKELRRNDIATHAAGELAFHCQKHDTDFPFTFTHRVDFYEPMKGKSKLDSCQSAVNDRLAAAKIEADEKAHDYRRKISIIPKSSMMLFNDLAQIIDKDYGDFVNLVTLRMEQDIQRQKDIEERNKQQRDAVHHKPGPHDAEGDVDVIPAEVAPPREIKSAEEIVQAGPKSFGTWWASIEKLAIMAHGEQPKDFARRMALMAWEEASTPF